MPQQLDMDAHPSVTELVSGIVGDAQQLVRQQLTLFQVELRHDLKRTARASVPLAFGLVVAMVALVILAAAASLLLPWLWPALPAWAGFAIVAAAFAVVAGALILWGKCQFDAFNPLPEQSVEGLKENIQWKTKN
jgi:uncharacterized membrane protein YqjE